MGWRSSGCSSRMGSLEALGATGPSTQLHRCEVPRCTPISDSCVQHQLPADAVCVMDLRLSGVSATLVICRRPRCQNLGSRPRIFVVAFHLLLSVLCKHSLLPCLSEQQA